MAREELNVFLNDEPIGVLSQIDGVLSFRYTADYAASFEAYPLSGNLPLDEGVFTGSAVENF